jgi:type I restriction enzyme S subunit
MSVDGWETALLGDRVSIRARIGWKGLQAGEYVDQGFIFLATPNIKGDRIDFRNVNYINERRFQESANLALEVGDVLLVKDGSTLGISNIVRRLPSPTTINGSIALLRCGAGLHPPFLHQLTKGQAFQKLVQDKKSGLGVPHLFQADLREFRVPSPPLPEQRRIAEILDTLDEAIRKTEQVIAKLQQMKQGLLHDLLTRGIDEHGELRDPERHPEQFEDSPLGRIPRGWEVAGFERFAWAGRPFLKTGPFGSSLKGEHWVEQGVPVITIGALGEGEFMESELLFISDDKARELAAYKVEPGDIVFSRVADVGRSVVVTPAECGWVLSSNLMWISLDPGQVDPSFVWLNLSANPTIRSQVRRSVNAGGREVANGSVLRSLRLGWPSLAEQERISFAASALQQRVAEESRIASKLRTLKQGLMDDLLTGRVRTSVPPEAAP